jgi:hypothetical protein
MVAPIEKMTHGKTKLEIDYPAKKRHACALQDSLFHRYRYES